MTSKEKRFNYKLIKGNKVIGLYKADNKIDLNKVIIKNEPKKYAKIIEDIYNKKIKIERSSIGKEKTILLYVTIYSNFGILTRIKHVMFSNGKKIDDIKFLKKHLNETRPHHIEVIYRTEDERTKRFKQYKKRRYENKRELFDDLYNLKRIKL